MEFQKLGKEDVKGMYALMEEAFPPEERRCYEDHKRLYDLGYFEIFGKKDSQNHVVAVISIWRLHGTRYVEHFVVAPSLRGQKIGEKLLQWVQKEKTPLLLEVELPEGEQEKRRIRFYERQGFFYNTYPYLQPPLHKGDGMLPLRFMTWPQKIDESTYHNYKKEVHQKVYFYFAENDTQE